MYVAHIHNKLLTKALLKHGLNLIICVLHKC